VRSSAICFGRHKIRLSPQGIFGEDKSRRSDGVDPVTGELAAKGEADVFQIGQSGLKPGGIGLPAYVRPCSGAKTYTISCLPGFSSRGRDQNL
jgi:hypothetical protein